MAVNYKHIARRIKQLRKERGMTQYELAELLDLSSFFISCIDAGKRGVSLETLDKIANIFNALLDWVVYGK